MVKSCNHRHEWTVARSNSRNDELTKAIEWTLRVCLRRGTAKICKRRRGGLGRRMELPGSGDRGCVLSHEQFDRLAIHLNLTDPNQMTEVRAHLNSIGEFYLRSRLYEAATPTQSERNAALAIVMDRFGAFCAAAETLAPLPEWPPSELPSVDDQ